MWHFVTITDCSVVLVFWGTTKPFSKAFNIPTNDAQRFQFLHFLFASVFTAAHKQPQLNRLLNKPCIRKPPRPVCDWLHYSCPPTQARWSWYLKKQAHPLIQPGPPGHQAMSLLLYPDIFPFRSTYQKPKLPSPQESHDLPLPSVFSLFSVTNIVSNYTEKLCQSLLCLKKGHLSFAVLKLKTS